MSAVRLFACCIVAHLSGADLTPDLILLARARYHMSQNLTRLPNYTCTQTIERMQRQPRSKRLKLIDIVRLEVAIADGKELYAWPGSRRFEEKELRELVSGTSATGQFGLYAKTIFQSNAPRFTFAGESFAAGRRLMQWEFVVSQMVSGQLLRVNDNEAVVGYHGSFWVDGETLDVHRFEVFSDDIPPHIGLQSASITVDYGKTRIGDGEFLLPSSASLEMVDLSGGVSRNRTLFSACRQYTGESTVMFDDPPPEAAPAPTISDIELPAGLRLDIALDTPIRIPSAAVGDPVTAVLKNHVKAQSGRAIPKGALVHGRITFLRPYDFARQSGWAIGLHFHAVEFEAMRGRIRSELMQIATASPIISMHPFTGNLRAVQPTLDLGGAASGSVFYVRSTKVTLDRGLRMFWLTKAGQSETEDDE
jgi:hypothetical protein